MALVKLVAQLTTLLGLRIQCSEVEHLDLE